MRRYLTKKMSGYFTVEAALLLPFVIMIIVFMIFLSFYCYDRCILEQCAYAAALRGSSNRFANTQEAYEEATGAAETLIEGKLFAVREVNTTVRVSGLAVTVSYECKMNMPVGNWLSAVVSKDALCMEVSKKVLRNKTVAILRQI
ncbi:MAG: pilus assembly protein [Lachnospiraceae bacterium]|nr:pilus assembly protein [Lachnospiraceae bacterium]